MARTVNKLEVLGTSYEVRFETPKDNSKLWGAQGLCEIYSHQIIVDPSGADDPLAFENIETHFRNVLRHEAFHAFFAEAGLMDYTEDETLVDFLAVQFTKIRDLMEAVDRIKIPGAADV